MNLIDAAGLTQAPIALEPYCRALGITGAVIEPDDRLAWLRTMHQADEPYVVYTGPGGADFWRLAHPRVVVRIVPGEGELTKRIDDPALHYLLAEGLSRTQAKAILARKGHLRKQREAKAYVYAATRPQRQVVGKMVREFVDRVFNGSARPLLVHLVEDRKLSEDERRELRRALEEAE
jgi:hypothetical protein